jgi:hypothetical protein
VLDLEAIAHQTLDKRTGDCGVVLDDKNLHVLIVACPAERRAPLPEPALMGARQDPRLLTRALPFLGSRLAALAIRSRHVEELLDEQEEP